MSYNVEVILPLPLDQKFTIVAVEDGQEPLIVRDMGGHEYHVTNPTETSIETFKTKIFREGEVPFGLVTVTKEKVDAVIFM